LKKTRKEVQNEFEELTSMQNQLKNDLDELKGLLSAFQKLQFPKQVKYDWRKRIRSFSRNLVE